MREEQTLIELAQQFGGHPNQIAGWKTLCANAAELFAGKIVAAEPANRYNAAKPHSSLVKKTPNESYRVRLPTTTLTPIRKAGWIEQGIPCRGFYPKTGSECSNQRGARSYRCYATPTSPVFPRIHPPARSIAATVNRMTQVARYKNCGGRAVAASDYPHRHESCFLPDQGSRSQDLTLPCGTRELS